MQSLHLEGGFRSYGDELIRLLFSTRGGKVVFSKNGIMQKPALFLEVMDRFVAQIDSEVDCVCALATSGLPMGVFLAQRLGRPLYFFKRQGWPLLDTGESYRILPQIPKGSKVILADSHVRTGHTSKLCQEEIARLSDKQTTVCAIATIIDLDHLGPARLGGLQQNSIMKMTDYLDFLRPLMNASSDAQLLTTDLAIDSPVWFYPPLPVDVGEPGVRTRRISHFLTLPRYDYSNIRLLDNDLVEYLKDYDFSSDYGIWEFFSQPQLVEYVCKQVGTKIDLGNFDVLVGTCALGTAFALSLAYHNQFQGVVIGSYPDPGLLPEPESLKGQSILLCQSRVTSGLHASEAHAAIERAGGQCTVMLTIQAALGRVEKLRRLPLGRLLGKGMKIFSLSISRN